MAQTPDNHGRFTEQVDGWFWLKVTSDLLNIFPTFALSNEAGGKELLKEPQTQRTEKNQQNSNPKRHNYSPADYCPKPVSAFSAAASGI